MGAMLTFEQTFGIQHVMRGKQSKKPDYVSMPTLT